jgi:uncharacterized membrane protein
MAQPPILPPLPRPSLLGRILAGLRNNFFAGVVVVAPIGLTVWLIWTVAGWVDAAVMPLVPRYYHPESVVNRWLGHARDDPEWIEVNVRGVGIVFFTVFTVFIGWIAKGLIGRSFLRWGEDLVGRVPVIRSVYNAVKQIAETMFTREGDVKFDKVCLVEWPRPLVWRIAFLLSPVKGEIEERLAPRGDFVTIFMPNTPNPATGFLMFCARSEIIELDMSFEEAAKLVVSGGLVAPPGANGEPLAVAPGPVALPLGPDGRAA